MKIISVRQPRAALIVNGLKDIENRTWRTNYKGALLIHASLRADDITADEIERRFGVRLSDDLPRGGIVGITEIVDCVRSHPSKWYAADQTLTDEFINRLLVDPLPKPYLDGYAWSFGKAHPK
jgi:ASCH domain